MTAEHAIKAKNIASRKENTTKDESKQFGEESSLDKVALNNKIVTLRQTTKKSKSHVLAKLIRQLKQLKNTTNEKAENTEKNKKNSETLVKEIAALKKLKPDTISRFVLGNTLTFAQLSAKGFQTIESRTLARFANESQLQKSVAEFRENHPDWKSLAAFLQTQSTGRQIKKNKNTKSKAEKKVNIRAKKALISNFLDEKANEMASDGDGEDGEEEEEVASGGKTLMQECNEDSSKQPKENIPSESNVKEIKKVKEAGVKSKDKQVTGVKSKCKEENELKSKDTQVTSVKPKQKAKLDVKSKNKQCKESTNNGNVKDAATNKNKKQMVVKRINLDDFGNDDIFGSQNSVSNDLLGTNSSDGNQTIERDLFATESHVTDFSEDSSRNFQDEDNDTPVFANHSMFLTLSDPIDSTTEGIRFGGRRGRSGYGSAFGRPSYSEYGKRGGGGRGTSSYGDQDNARYRGRGAGYSRGQGRDGRHNQEGFNQGRRGRGGGREGDSGYRRGRGGREDAGNGRGRGGREDFGNRQLGRNDNKMNNDTFTNKRDFHERKSFEKGNSNTISNKGVSSKKLHPSWEASRKRKLEISGVTAFQGKKITFSDD
ncbi:serum response factor-binding protein 1 [Octopus bimaculoides]|uniref:Serum response factor-binding protein 1 n=1 Tax=Octopus bimaculoides TaxID=37653 RepID=A0A0L8FFZ9_OCTBM|nr:serum response factor-binding protein 1 [Octopus bimaculoides]|eukprot:XP_014790179.1 PREDICTED: serum response factor-binding protein 1-like [Octopus bimaculoides]